MVSPPFNFSDNEVITSVLRSLTIFEGLHTLELTLRVKTIRLLVPVVQTALNSRVWTRPPVSMVYARSQVTVLSSTRERYRNIAKYYSFFT